MCLHPVKIYKRGKYKQNTYNGLKGEPYEIEAWTKCGTCAECMAEKANSWVVRNYYESQAHNKICFITLTYKVNPTVLIKRDLQNFLKRLRKHLDKEIIKIRYFAVGEYGTKFKRPHYHIIIYGWEEKPEKLYWNGINKKCNLIFTSETIQKAWGLGRTSYQKFCIEEIPYISLYATPNDTTHEPIRLTREKIRQYENQMKKLPEIEKLCKKNIKILGKALENLKTKHQFIKEFNTWSEGLGYDWWEKNVYLKSIGPYCWKEAINDGVYNTPTSWIKKLANEGNMDAIEEMWRRKAFEEERQETEQDRECRKIAELNHKDMEDIIEWHDTEETKTIL